MGWFKLYDEFAWDPKVTGMTEQQQRRYIMLLCLRNIGDTATTSDEQVARFMGIRLAQVKRTKEVFKELGFIDEGWNVTHWDERQSDESESAKRMRRMRARRHSVTSQSDDRQTERQTDKQNDVAPTSHVAQQKEQPEPGPEYTAVGELAMNLAGEPSWGAWVVGQGRIGHPAHWIKMAVETAHGGGKLHKPYVAKILQGWASGDGPPKQHVNGVPPKPSPYVPTEEERAASRARTKAANELIDKLEATKTWNPNKTR